MKKFFRFVCLGNACGIAAFSMVCIYLFFIWRLIRSGLLLAQSIATLCMLFYLCSSIAGLILAVLDVIRRIAANKNQSAPTEASAD